MLDSGLPGYNWSTTGAQFAENRFRARLLQSEPVELDAAVAALG